MHEHAYDYKILPPFLVYVRINIAFFEKCSFDVRIFIGENIQFYPEGTHLIGVDWNVKLGEYLVKGNRSCEFSHVIIERLIMGDGSSLKEVITGCIDVVVTTRSLCSVKSIQSTLQEIRRVLAPVRFLCAKVKIVNLHQSYTLYLIVAN